MHFSPSSNKRFLVPVVVCLCLFRLEGASVGRGRIFVISQSATMRNERGIKKCGIFQIKIYPRTQ